MGYLDLEPEDRILWVLSEYGDKMGKSKLRRSVGMRYTMLDPVLEELARKGKINITAGKHGELISLENVR
jgi:hypothetical protein